VDIATITTPPVGTATAPAVAHARLLTAALLHDVALASPAAIASILNGETGRLEENHRGYRRVLTRTPHLAGELEQLTQAIQTWTAPAPTPPATTHHERMLAIANAIKTRALETFPPGPDSVRALRASMLACRTHTDL